MVVVLEVVKEGGNEGGKLGGSEGGRDGGKLGGSEGGKEGGKEGGTDGGKEGGMLGLLGGTLGNKEEGAPILEGRLTLGTPITELIFDGFEGAKEGEGRRIKGIRELGNSRITLGSRLGSNFLGFTVMSSKSNSFLTCDIRRVLSRRRRFALGVILLILPACASLPNASDSSTAPAISFGLPSIAPSIFLNNCSLCFVTGIPLGVFTGASLNGNSRNRSTGLISNNFLPPTPIDCLPLVMKAPNPLLTNSFSATCLIRCSLPRIAISISFALLTLPLGKVSSVPNDPKISGCSSLNSFRATCLSAFVWNAVGRLRSVGSLGTNACGFPIVTLPTPIVSLRTSSVFFVNRPLCNCSS